MGIGALPRDDPSRFGFGFQLHGLARTGPSKRDRIYPEIGR